MENFSSDSLSFLWNNIHFTTYNFSFQEGIWKVFQIRSNSRTYLSTCRTRLPIVNDQKEVKSLLNIQHPKSHKVLGAFIKSA